VNVAEQLLNAYDSASLWEPTLREALPTDISAAYHHSFSVRDLRIARGEHPLGYKIGFTTEAAMQKYGISAPMWGLLWNTTVCDASGRSEPFPIDLADSLQPRLEPELVVQLGHWPNPSQGQQGIFQAIAAVGIGFEVVQCHCTNWELSAATAIADGGLHSKLIVGGLRPLKTIARDVTALNEMLRAATVHLSRDGVHHAIGTGENVLGSPLRALELFMHDLDRYGRPPLGHLPCLITTGSWTNPFPVEPGQQWSAHFSHALGDMSVAFL
jgi:2-oxo-3-hexenedioate decarboxylase